MDGDDRQHDGLTYAPARPAAWYVRHRRVLLIVLAAIVVGVAVRRWGWVVWGPVRVAYLQRQALAYHAAGDRAIYQANPEDKLSSSRALVFDAPMVWDRYLEAAGMRTWPVLYLGRRVSPGGHERVVLARVAGTYSFLSSNVSQPSFHFGILAKTILQGTVTSLPREARPMTVGLGVEVVRGTPVRMFAGQEDPVDQSHLTIVYDVGGQRGTIDGYLQDDDTVKLSVRDGPALGSGAIDVIR